MYPIPKINTALCHILAKCPLPKIKISLIIPEYYTEEMSTVMYKKIV